MSVTNGDEEGPSKATAEHGDDSGSNIVNTDDLKTSKTTTTNVAACVPSTATSTATNTTSDKCGGEDVVVITHDELCVEEIVRGVSSPTCGGTATFIGTTRNTFQGRHVLRLEYEGYESMARKSLLKICAEIREKWDDVYGIALVHRLGIVPVGEASVIIAVSAPHRRAALHAVEYAIDTLKARVPIWKKEYFADGNSEWKANCEGCTLAKNRRRPCGHH